MLGKRHYGWFTSILLPSKWIYLTGSTVRFLVLHSRKTVVFMCKVDFMPVQDFKRGKTPHLLSETFYLIQE